MDKVDSDLQKALDNGSGKGWTLHSFQSLGEENRIHLTFIWQVEES